MRNHDNCYKTHAESQAEFFFTIRHIRTVKGRNGTTDNIPKYCHCEHFKHMFISKDAFTSAFQGNFPLVYNRELSLGRSKQRNRMAYTK